MAVRLPIDIATRVSAELSAFIERLVNDPDREESPTLEEARNALRGSDRDTAAQAAMHPQDRDSALAEINGLIEEYGGDMLAHYFVVAKASEGLSRIIETAASDRALPRAPTLARVRQAMLEGLTARLAGDGAIDPEDDGTLLAEIDDLIRRHGADAVAEDFIRFE
jgi:hypothetical protein